MEELIILLLFLVKEEFRIFQQGVTFFAHSRGLCIDKSAATALDFCRLFIEQVHVTRTTRYQLARVRNLLE